MKGLGHMNGLSTGIAENETGKEREMTKRHMVRVSAICALLFALLAIPLAVQANVTVTTLDDSGPGSLRQAIVDAGPGVVIDFAVTGTIVLTNGQLQVLHDISVTGPGASHLTISGNHATRVFEIGSQFGGCPSVHFTGLTIANGNAIGPNTGAGESYGGGVFNRGNLTLDKCTLDGNSADESGGGIYTTSYYGGKLTIIDSVLRNNSAPSGAGGAICNSGVAAISGSCISSNTASSGGGIWGVFAGSVTMLTNTTVSGNTAGQGGGVGNAIDSTLSVDSCTIYGNSATSYGGGLLLGGDYDDVFTIRNSIVAGNNAPVGPDVSGPRELISLDYNLIQNTSGCAIIGVTTHNIYGQNPLLGPLTNLGGPTPTHAMRFDSPAVDAGKSSGLSTDQRGFPRPIDSLDVANADGGDGSDIGAYEMNPDTQVAIFTAVEVAFGTTLGRTYRVESSTDLQTTWTPVETGIAGTGGEETRLYSIRATPKRFFRAVRE